MACWPSACLCVSFSFYMVITNSAPTLVEIPLGPTCEGFHPFPAEGSPLSPRPPPSWLVLAPVSDAWLLYFCLSFYSCLENPMESVAWRAIVHKVTKSWTQVSTHTYESHTWFFEWWITLANLEKILHVCSIWFFIHIVGLNLLIFCWGLLHLFSWEILVCNFVFL